MCNIGVVETTRPIQGNGAIEAIMADVKFNKRKQVGRRVWSNVWVAKEIFIQMTVEAVLAYIKYTQYVRFKVGELSF